MSQYEIICGDCVEVMRGMPENSVDAIVADPPYGLGFMGKEWDTFDKSQFGRAGSEGENDLKVKKNFRILPRIAQGKALYEFGFAWATEALRVLKPGGYLLSFGGTRTYHRMACAVEDAGFEIRDMIDYLYGSGFPKSHDISKAIDKAAGVKRKSLGRNPNSRERCGKDNSLYEPGTVGKTAYLTTSATPEAQQWSGWGTALKPAHEPIVLARKPLSEKTVAANVLKWGTGGVNVDGCRIGSEEITQHGRRDSENRAMAGRNYAESAGRAWQGRWPANVVLDEEAGKMLDEQSGELKSGKPAGLKTGGQGNAFGYFKGDIPVTGFGDSGGASRFFYCAKSSRSEREAGLRGVIPCHKCGGLDTETHIDEKTGKSVACIRNPHPTVKPLSLMRWLCRLITPPGGLILDPFAGSGSTGCAVVLEGFRIIIIEKDPHDCEIARARIAYWQREARDEAGLFYPTENHQKGPEYHAQGEGTRLV